VYRQARDQEARSGAAGGLVGSPAPDFTLEAMDGSKVAFREATRGKVVLLSFWGVACSYCRKEAPYLTKLQEKFGDKGFTVIAVNGYDEDRETVAEYLAQEKLKHPVLLMGRGIARSKYQVTGFPTNVWIDAAGNVAHTEVGFTADHYSVMEARIQRMLASVQRANLEAISR
jgi:cytochrome c biogenesis protein CcmG/thiol:disulfide interchange protein DsbE